MIYHLRITLSMLAIVCGFALDIDWKIGMSTEEQQVTVPVGTDVFLKWSGNHDVYKFPDNTAYDKCDFSQATEMADDDDSPYPYKATSPGIVYFGCSIGPHCKLNQKLALTVTGMFSVWANLFRRTVVI